MILNTIAERVLLMTLCTLSAFGIIGIFLIISNLREIVKLFNAADDIYNVAKLIREECEERARSKTHD